MEFLLLALLSLCRLKNALLCFVVVTTIIIVFGTDVGVAYAFVVVMFVVIVIAVDTPNNYQRGVLLNEVIAW